MVRLRDLDRDPWIAEIVSDKSDERLLIGKNGKIALEQSGWLVEIWPGFPEEQDFDFEEFYGEEEASMEDF
jgi:hypothetical protein